MSDFIDRYNAEPIYISVPEDAVTRVEIAVCDVLADPGLQFGILPADRDRLVASLAELTGKPQHWIEGFVEGECERQRAVQQFHDTHMRGGVCGG